MRLKRDFLRHLWAFVSATVVQKQIQVIGRKDQYWRKTNICAVDTKRGKDLRSSSRRGALVPYVRAVLEHVNLMMRSAGPLTAAN